MVTNVRGIMSNLMEGRGERALNGLTVTGDRGYGRETLLEKLSNCEASGLVVLLEHWSGAIRLSGSLFWMSVGVTKSNLVHVERGQNHLFDQRASTSKINQLCNRRMRTALKPSIIIALVTFRMQLCRRTLL